MEHVRQRPSGARAKVCLVLAGLLVWLVPRSLQAAPLDLPATETEPGVVVYPAAQTGAHGITVVLHGMCGEPTRTCSHFAEQVTSSEHLVCPRASQRCEGGGASWPQAGFIEQIERAVARAEQTLGERVDASRGRTLIGYSLGAYRALELAQRGGGKYPRVMLIGAKIFPNQKLLRESGVERLLLSAGSWDMMHDHMQRETQRLLRGGFTTRFLGLGPVGHHFTPSFAQYLPEALRWLEAA